MSWHSKTEKQSEVWWLMPIVSECRWWWQEEQDFEIVSSPIVSWRKAWVTLDYESVHPLSPNPLEALQLNPTLK